VAHLLIVDDDEDVAEVFRRHLEADGHTCDVAHSGDDALELVLEAQREYDLILCDLRMSPISGKGFLDLVHPMVHEKTPVIVISAWPHLMEALGDARRHVFLTLQKPVVPGQLVEAVGRALDQRRLLQKVRDLEVRVEELRAQAVVLTAKNRDLYGEVRIDGLTALPNRRRLEEDLDVFRANTGRYGARFAIAFCDLDDFARFNNEQSYGVGDSVIRAVADRLRSTMRRGDSVYRYGGDEFVMILAYQSLPEALQAAERFRKAFDEGELTLPDGAEARVTLSGGVVAVTEEADRSVAELLDDASRLCKEAKADGGNRVYPTAE
jgi:diguanylate cyclase (GGDEF)-like protein